MATIYIFNGTQSGTADGSYADPYDFSSLATQEAASSSGDVFIFKDGTYAQTANLTLGASGVSYEAETLGGVTFNFSSTYTLSLGDSANNYAGFTLKGIIFDNINTILSLRIIDGDLLLAEDCQFKGMSSSYRCIIGDTSPYDNGYAINATFRRCVFSGTATVSEVRFFRYRVGAAMALTLENCSIILFGIAGIFQDSHPGTATIKNCIAYADNSSSLLGTPLGFTETNNCYYNLNESADPANGIIVDDPLFVDFANGDYRLRPSSPCINAGTAS